MTMTRACRAAAVDPPDDDDEESTALVGDATLKP
jgi:hypothetical protein